LKVAIQAKADLYIAHNAGALAVAGDAAKKNRKQFGFDAEDFHRGEVLSCKAFKATVAIEDAYLPNAVYITAASPLIKEEYGKLYDKAKITTIRNVFPFIKQAQVVMENQALKLFWFSQTVGTNRGIQDVIKAMKVLEKNDLELHVYGHLSPAVEKIFNELIISLDFKEAPKIYFKDSVSPDELLHLATSFDIGLAIEPGFCKNNEIALSNKIFTYLVGGNAIIFSSTPAQRHFFEQYENIGFLYSPGDVDILAKHIAAYDCNRQLLNFHKKSSRELFLGELNWEEEQEILVKEVDKVIAV
jgi:glycosyltransferase involved in cell wall biosynthesis